MLWKLVKPCQALDWGLQIWITGCDVAAEEMGAWRAGAADIF